MLFNGESLVVQEEKGQEMDRPWLHHSVNAFNASELYP